MSTTADVVGLKADLQDDLQDDSGAAERPAFLELPTVEFYDEGDIAAALGVTKPTVNRRARRGRRDRRGGVTEAPWRVDHGELRQGGLAKIYRYSDLPQDVRWALDRYDDGGPLPAVEPEPDHWNVQRAGLVVLGFVTGLLGGVLTALVILSQVTQ